MSARRLLVFDVDGTLVDSQAHIHSAMTRAFAASELPPPPLAEVLSIVGLSLPEAIAALIPEASPEAQARIVADYKAGFTTLRAAEMAPLYPGALQAVRRLAAAPGQVLGIATGKSRRGLDHLLAAYDFGSHFATQQVADDHPSKPHPSMLLRALAETGCAAGTAVMIGDTSFDIEMGRAAGMTTIGVAWGYHPVARLQAAGADRIVTDYAELERILGAVAA